MPDQRNEPAIHRALVERVASAARELVAAVELLAADPVPPSGPAARVGALHPLISRLTDAAAFAEIHAWREPGEIAAVLALSKAEARRRYRGGPPNLPLSVVLADAHTPMNEPAMTSTAPPSDSRPQPAPYLPGEALTRRAVTVITVLIALMSFAFSLGNVTALALYLGIPAYIAWLIGPSVDLSVLGLLIGLRYLVLRGFSDATLRKPRCLMLFSGLLTLALNVAHSVAAHLYGTALVDAVGPALLIGWGETGPWMLRQIYAAPTEAADQPEPVDVPEPEPAAQPTDETDTRPFEQPDPRPAAVTEAEADEEPRPWTAPTDLLATARTLDTAHRATTGRPISRDKLRAELRIGRDRAAALVGQLRTEASHRAVMDAQAQSAA